MLLSLLLGAPEVKINAQSLNSSLPCQNSSQSQSSISTNGNAQQADENITLVGQIGPYDPSQGDQDDPNFNDFTGADLEGTLPTDNYFTISVTVPTALDFTVLEDRTNVKGQFYSPQYMVTNNATRPVHISVVAVQNVVPVENDPDFIPLYLEKPVEGDGKVQIDLNLSLKNMQTSVFHNVNLTSLISQNPTNPITRATSTTNQNVPSNYLGVLGLKEKGILQLNSTDWDRPKAEGLDKNAKVNFDIQLTFSLDDPTTNSTPSQGSGN